MEAESAVRLATIRVATFFLVLRKSNSVVRNWTSAYWLEFATTQFQSLLVLESQSPRLRTSDCAFGQFHVATTSHGQKPYLVHAAGASGRNAPARSIFDNPAIDVAVGLLSSAPSLCLEPSAKIDPGFPQIDISAEASRDFHTQTVHRNVRIVAPR